MSRRNAICELVFTGLARSIGTRDQPSCGQTTAYILMKNLVEIILNFLLTFLLNKFLIAGYSGDRDLRLFYNDKQPALII